jgi:hypothetical protein
MRIIVQGEGERSSWQMLREKRLRRGTLTARNGDDNKNERCLGGNWNLLTKKEATSTTCRGI